MLAYILGKNCVAGLLTMGAVMGFNASAGRLVSHITKKDLQAADARLTTLREVITNITSLKFLCWETPYLAQLHAKREVECHWLLRFRLTSVMSISLGRASPVRPGAGRS